MHGIKNLFWLVSNFAVTGGLIFLFFGLATSRALVNMGFAIIVAGIIFDGKYRNFFREILCFKLLLPILMTFILLLSGLVWGEGSSEIVDLHLKIYANLLLSIPVFAALNSNHRARCAWIAFFVGCILMVVLTYYRFIALHLDFAAPPGNLTSKYAVLSNYAVQGLITVFCCLALALAWGFAKNLRIRILVAVTLWSCITSLLFMLESKTALVALVIISIFFAFTRGIRVGVLVILIIVVVVPVVFFLSPSLAAEWQSLASDLSALVSGQPYDRNSSNGYRLAMWSAALQLISQSLWFGHGTGSYASLSPQFFNAAECAVACVHPHNQWLFFGVEYGLLGVAVISFLVYRMAVMGWMATGYSRHLTWGLALLFIVDAMFNAPMWLPGERVFFFSMFALLAAQIRLNLSETRDQLP